MGKRTTDETMELALIKQRLEQLDEQTKRILSHIESEQRVSINQGKLIDQLRYSVEMQNAMVQKSIDNQMEIIKRHEAILLNGGKGLTFEVDRLKHRITNMKDARATVIAVIGVIISVLGVVIKLIGG